MTSDDSKSQYPGLAPQRQVGPRAAAPSMAVQRFRWQAAGCQRTLSAATRSRAWGSHSESSRIPWKEKDRDDDGDACVQRPSDRDSRVSRQGLPVPPGDRATASATGRPGRAACGKVGPSPDLTRSDGLCVVGGRLSWPVSLWPSSNRREDTNKTETRTKICLTRLPILDLALRLLSPSDWPVCLPLLPTQAWPGSWARQLGLIPGCKAWQLEAW